jgi:hypothetical protein
MLRRLAAALCALALGAARVTAAPDAHPVVAPATAAPIAIDDVIREVARLRGLGRTKRIVSAALPADALAAKVGADRATAPVEAQDDALGFAAARLGLIPAAGDVHATAASVAATQVVGYYDRATRHLYVGDAPTVADPLGRRLLLAHEIDHALIDQHFDLTRLLDARGLDGDALAARQALVEGDAMAIMAEVVLAQVGAPAPWADPEAAATLDHSLATGGPAAAALGGASPWLRDRLMFPYRAGLAFVAGIRRRQAWAAVDAAYRRPPRSTEQLLHAEAYAADEPPVAIALATPPSLADWRARYADVWGVAGWLGFLRAHRVAAAPAATAAAGWGGDRVAVFARADDDDPRHAIAIAVTTWDSEVDAIEAAEALVRAIDDFAGIPLERGAEGGRWVDGARLAWVERRGPHVLVVVGAPVALAPTLRAEIWASATANKHAIP